MKDGIRRAEPKHATTEIEGEGLQGESSFGRFSGFLTCNAILCGELVAVSGDYNTQIFSLYEDLLDEEVEHESTTYHPKSMYPAPEIITTPKILNAACKRHLTKAYELIWVDTAACANRLRIVVELLLDQLEIPRKGKKRNRRTGDLDLSERIELLEASKPGHQHTFDALRHVGNVGSHEGDADFNFVLDCFELLEDALIELLELRREKLRAKALKVIEGKGKPQR